MIQIYNGVDDTLVQDLVITGIVAGADSDVLTLHVWSERGNPLGQQAAAVRLLLRVEDETGTYVATGLPPLDELWMRARLTGQIADSHPEQQPIVTSWTPWGAYVVLELGTIEPDCARVLELKVRPPSSAQALTYRWAIARQTSEYSVPAPAHLSALSSGILTGVGERDRSALVRGAAVAPSTPEDDQVLVAASLALVAGELDGVVQHSATLDQTDSAATPLAAGESYVATLTRAAGGVTITKGLVGTPGTPPTPPAGEPIVADVTVSYQGGGTSVITAADVDTSRAGHGRLLTEPAGGLDVRVWPGRALYGGTYRSRTASETLTVPDDAVTVIGQRASGHLDTWSPGARPETTALDLWQVTAAAGAVTDLEDLRRYAGRSRLLELRGSTGTTPGATVATLRVADPELHVELADYRLSALGGGSGGQWTLSYKVGGVTAYPSSATDDQRAAIAWDAADLTHTGGVPEVLILRRGDVLELVVDEVPTGAASVEAELILTCRVP